VNVNEGMILQQAVIDARFGWDWVADRWVGLIGWVQWVGLIGWVQWVGLIGWVQWAGRDYWLVLYILVLGYNIHGLVLCLTSSKGIGVGTIGSEGILGG
jgi:hypothetical protein